MNFKGRWQELRLPEPLMKNTKLPNMHSQLSVTLFLFQSDWKSNLLKFPKLGKYQSWEETSSSWVILLDAHLSHLRTAIFRNHLAIKMRLSWGAASWLLKKWSTQASVIFNTTIQNSQTCNLKQKTNPAISSTVPLGISYLLFLLPQWDHNG